MANTYSQIYIQIVFAVQGRRNFLKKSWRNRVFMYMAGIIRNREVKPIIVNGVEDHLHILIGLPPNVNLSDLVKDIKARSSKFINKQHLLPYRFEWQRGFGAFSYGHSQLERVYEYIKHQENIHAQRTFKKEYMELLERFEVEYDGEYVFEFYE